jgi:hypothetical protein
MWVRGVVNSGREVEADVPVFLMRLKMYEG